MKLELKKKESPVMLWIIGLSVLAALGTSGGAGVVKVCVNDICGISLASTHISF